MFEGNSSTNVLCKILVFALLGGTAKSRLRVLAASSGVVRFQSGSSKSVCRIWNPGINYKSVKSYKSDSHNCFTIENYAKNYKSVIPYKSGILYMINLTTTHNTPQLHYKCSRFGYDTVHTLVQFCAMVQVHCLACLLVEASVAR